MMSLWWVLLIWMPFRQPSGVQTTPDTSQLSLPNNNMGSANFLFLIGWQVPFCHILSSSRIFLGPPSVFPSPGAYSWTYLDRLFANLHLPVLCFSHLSPNLATSKLTLLPLGDTVLTGCCRGRRRTNSLNCFLPAQTHHGWGRNPHGGGVFCSIPRSYRSAHP